MSTSSCSVRPCKLKGRQAIAISNDVVSITVLLGGGHIALVQVRPPRPLLCHRNTRSPPPRLPDSATTTLLSVTR